MSIADELVQEIAQKLELRSGDPPRFMFGAKPTFVVRRLLALSAFDRKRALERLAVFAFFLAKEKSSPEAGYALLAVLEDFAKRTATGSAP